MADGVRLDAAEIKPFKKRLETEVSNLKQQINAQLTEDHARDYTSVIDAVMDRGDASVADLYTDLGLARIERHVDRLKDVEDALYRCEQGSYGTCLDCSGLIALDRLRADPAVQRCIACQAQREGTPSAKDVTPSL